MNFGRTEEQGIIEAENIQKQQDYSIFGVAG